MWICKIAISGRPFLLAFVCVLLLPVIHGCDSDEKPKPQAGGDSGAREVLLSLRFDHVLDAARTILTVDHTRAVSVVHRDSDGDTLGAEEIRVSFRDGRASVDTTRSGRLARVRTTRLLGPDVRYATDSLALRSIIPTDPFYLSDRAVDAYDFVRSDENGAPAIEVRLRDPDETESDLSRAIFVYDPETRQVVKLSIQRERSSFFVRSRTESRLSIAFSDSIWLPERYEFRQIQRSLLQPSYDLSRTERFSFAGEGDHVPEELSTTERPSIR